MKKVKFTLGLALAMLFVSANFVNAGKEVGYKSDHGSATSIGYSLSVQPNPQLFSIENSLRDYSYKNKGQAVNYETFVMSTFAYADATTTGGDVAKKGYSNLLFGSKDYYKQAGIINGGVLSYERRGDATADPTTMNPKLNGVWSVEENSYNLYNDIIIEMDFKEGLEIVPVIKRTIVLGEWYYANHDDDKDVHGHKGKGNRIDPTDVVVVDYLRHDSLTFRPIHDRGTDIAKFVYSQNVVELFNRFPVFSISYEVSFHDEIGTPGQEAHDPPVMVLPENMRGLKFEFGAGITSDIPMNILGNTLYVTSGKKYDFTVFSSKEIDVTSNRSNDPYDGIVVEKHKELANAYLVTVKGVNKDFTVKVVQKSGSQSDLGDEETTGNDGAATDAVWGANGTLYVNAATPGTIAVYSVTGQLYKKEVISGSYSLSMPKGLYIVQLNGKAYKVVL